MALLRDYAAGESKFSTLFSDALCMPSNDNANADTQKQSNAMSIFFPVCPQGEVFRKAFFGLRREHENIYFAEHNVRLLLTNRRLYPIEICYYHNEVLQGRH